MSVSAEVLRLHLGYNAWASLRLLDAAARLKPEELTHDFETADGTILDTLAHIYAADRIWMARATGAPASVFMTDADRDLEVLQAEWPPLLERWKTWGAELTDVRSGEEVAYRDLKHTPCTLCLWQLVMHLVNHGTHHRGQVAGFLRSLGYGPPPLDLVYYYRQQ